MNHNQIDTPNKFDRNTVIQLLQNANKQAEYKFSIHLAQQWLDLFHGDIKIEYLLSEAYFHWGKLDEAYALLKRIVFTDPEFISAHRLLAYSSHEFPYQSKKNALDSIYALGGKISTPPEQEHWSSLVRYGKEMEKQGNFNQAGAFYAEAVTNEPESPLPAVYHLNYIYRNLPWNKVKEIGEIYSSRWPDTIACQLIFADILNNGGEEENAVDFLHHAASLDISREVPIKIWGPDHPYKQLWPSNPQILLNIPIPASIAVTMGWNQLPKGNPILPEEEASAPITFTKQRKSSDVVIKSVENDFSILAAKLKKPELGDIDGRYPAFVIISSKSGLEKQFGIDHIQEIDSRLQILTQETQKLKGWNAHLIYVDDLESTDDFGLPPAVYSDPWSIKKFINDLDIALGTKGEKIGALLIVGGNQVIPFHLLPNPIDDFDANVPSDNPYGSNDENYFIPSWPVGRLPGSSESDPPPLIKQIDTIIESRKTNKLNKQPPSNFKRILDYFWGIISQKSGKGNFGYSAEIWRRASNAVYRPIGKPHQLAISPPLNSNSISTNGYSKKDHRLAYFNLHGLEDASEWFGQYDPVNNDHQGADYPIAIRPEDIPTSKKVPQIIFSEACFGANIINKTVDEAICLKYLDSGSSVIVGSTCTSYGSLSSPLIAADLLGKAFWSYIQDGFTAGEAFQKSKIYLAKEMNKRQGYLDGEDQKTLISFVLYGDPLNFLELPSLIDKNSKLEKTFINSSSIHTVCDKTYPHTYKEVPQDVMEKVKGFVKLYLPGMENAEVLFSEEHLHCQGHTCPSPTTSKSKINPSRKVIALSKQIPGDKNIHPHYARFTFDDNGKITKLAVSR